VLFGDPRAAARLIALVLLGAAVVCLGCASIPRGTAAVDGVSVQGNDKLSSSDVEEKMATAPSPRFLGVFQGLVYDYEIFDRNVLQRDLERVERYYRARGYYEAHARAGRVRYSGAKHVSVTVEVEEGRPVLVHDMQIDGIEGLSPKDVAAVRSAMAENAKRGKPFEEDPFQKAENTMKRALTKRGYAWAKVERRADVDLPRHEASLVFTVRPGPKSKIGAIRVEGFAPLPEAPIRRALDVTPGDAYSSADLDTAQQAVLALGTFSSVEITPDLVEPPPADGVVPIVVRVQLQKLKSVVLGGGIELDSIRAEAHLHVGWEHKNLFGGFRHFIVDLKPGVDLYPTRIPEFSKPTAALPAEHLRAEFRQPGFLEARTNGVITQQLNTYPVLLTPTVDPSEPVIGYLEYKGSIGLERTLWKLFGSPTYQIQYNRPFTYIGTLDPDLRGVVVSAIDLLTRFDFRDSTTKPHKGIYLQNDFQFAGVGGDARDFRIQPEVRGYVPVGKKVTIAARAMVGFLFPLNYGNTLAAASDGQPVTDRADWVKDIELIYLRGFFSGGPSSNRGYPLQGVGPHGIAPFFSPTLSAQALAQSCPAQSTDPRCAVPLGGLSIWESSIEMRFPIYGAIGGSVFCDASDVSPDRLSIRLNHPHLSCGPGLRYDTPIGPVRLDVGFRIPGAQVPAGTNPEVEGNPGTFYGVPMAFAFGIGEVF
jgi:outer membrane protein assembly factor BamA